MKRITFIFLALLICISVIGCNKTTDNKTDTDESNITEAEDPEHFEPSETIDIIPIQEAMLAAAPSLPEMLTLNSNDEDSDYTFSYLCDIDYSKIGSYFLSYSTKASADEIAVIALNNKADVSAVTKSLEEHVQSRIDLFSTYAQDEVEKLNNALIFSKDNFVVLIICDDSQEVKNAFLNSVA